VYRARSHDHEQSIIPSFQDGFGAAPRLLDSGSLSFAQRPFMHEHGRLDQGQDFGDAEVVGGMKGAHERERVGMGKGGSQDGGERTGVNDQWTDVDRAEQISVAIWEKRSHQNCTPEFLSSHSRPERPMASAVAGSPWSIRT
jgi:hypothetical protein